MKRRERRNDDTAPVVGAAPVVAEVLAVADDQGRLMVTVDGAVVTASPIGRAAFMALVDELLRRRQHPLALVLIEADGTRYTDTLHPGLPTPASPPAPSSPPAALVPPAQQPERERETVPESLAAARPESVRIGRAREGGFIPGEAVGIAQITMHQSADTDGRIPMLEEPIPDGVEVVLIGRISGTLLLLPQ